MVAGGTVSFPLPFNSVRFLTTQLVSEMGYASGLHRQVLFSVGLVLFVFYRDNQPHPYETKRKELWKMTSINGKRRRIGDDVVYFFIYLCAALSSSAACRNHHICICQGNRPGKLAVSDQRDICIKRHCIGIAGNLLNTLYIIIITMLIAAPVGVGAAIT